MLRPILRRDRTDAAHHRLVSPVSISGGERSDPRMSRSTLVVAGFLAFTAMNLLWNQLDGTPVYTEPLVGSSTWNGLDKARDFRAFVVFLTLTSTLVLGLHALVRRLAAQPRGADVARAFETLLGLSLFPAAYWLGHHVAFGSAYSPPYDAAVGIVLVLISIAALWRHRRGLDSETVFELVGAAVLLETFGFLGGCGVATLLDRLAPGWLASRPWLGWVLGGSGLGLATLSAVGALVRSRDGIDARQRLNRRLLIVQVPLPLLYFALLTPRLLLGRHPEPAIYTVWLPVLLSLPVVVAWYGLVRRARRTLGGGLAPKGIRSVLSPLCLGAVAVFLQVAINGLPWFSLDPFHLGEQMLPWHQWTRFGKIPYVDLVPIHGLMPLLRGLANDVLFQGTAVSFTQTDGLLAAASALTTFLMIWAFAGPFPALFVSLTLALSAPYLFDRCYFLVPGLLVLALPSLVRRPIAWLWVWGLLSLIMVAYNFAVGIAIGLGTIPLALWFAWRAFRDERDTFLKSLAILSLIVMGLLVIDPTRRVALGFLRYLRENGATNTILHGIPWAMSFTVQERLPGLPSHRFLLEIMRMSWIGVLVLLGRLAWEELAEPRERRRDHVLVLTIGGAGTLLALATWTLGRIDPGHWSRPGAVTFLAVGALIPVLGLHGRRPTETVGIVTLIAALAGLLSTEEARTLPERLIARAVATPCLPAETRLVDGRELTLPGLGRGFDNPELINELRGLKAALDCWLPRGETYLDLTNRSAYYVYLDLPVPALYAASFIAGNRSTQARMLDQLRRDEPPVVLIGPSLNYDGAPASLRSYHLYREYVSRYVPVERNGFTLLVHPTLAPDAGPPGSEEQLERLDRVFVAPQLRRLPATWGKSWTKMAPLFSDVVDLGPDRLASTTALERLPEGRFRCLETEARLRFALPPIQGDEADFLRFRFTPKHGKPGMRPQLQVRWRTSGREEVGPIFTVDKGEMVVPLGAYPRWLLGRDIDAVEIMVLTTRPGFQFAVEDVRLMRLSEPVL
jgi:hypothetical protein